jgi:hypothetical protein
LYDEVLLEVDGDGDIVIPPVVGRHQNQMILKRMSLYRMPQAMIQVTPEMVLVAVRKTLVRKRTRMRMKVKRMNILI